MIVGGIGDGMANGRTVKEARKATPREIELSVLDNSRRRCALCFHLKGDLSEQHGQIAHLDENRANYTEDNLCFLCLPHHSVFDSTTSQHKNYTIAEVKQARKRLYEAIQAGQHLGNQPVARQGVEEDRMTLKAIVEAMGGNAMTFLRDHDLGNSFDWERLEGLKVVVQDRRHAEHEFIDPQLEMLRTDLVQKGAALIVALRTYTFLLENGSGWVKIPDHWEELDSRMYFERIGEMNDAANLVCAAYDALVRTARARLA